MTEPRVRGGVLEARLSLSRRETEVREMASLGLTNTQIANRLTVSHSGVKFYVAPMYRKLGVANRTAATIVYSKLQAGEG
jgi:DNA-binding NarL/FixJ family response regulator